MGATPLGWAAFGLGLATIVFAELLTGCLRQLVKGVWVFFLECLPAKPERQRMKSVVRRLDLQPGVYCDVSEPSFHVFVTPSQITLADQSNAWVLVDQPELTGSGIGMKCVSHGKIVGTVSTDPDIFNKQWLQVNGPGGVLRRAIRRCD